LAVLWCAFETGQETATRFRGVRTSAWRRSGCRLCAQVQSLPAPEEPLAPGATCSHADGEPALPALGADAPGGVAKAKEGIGEVHVSVALMEEFLQCAPGAPRRGALTPARALLGRGRERGRARNEPQAPAARLFFGWMAGGDAQIRPAP